MKLSQKEHMLLQEQKKQEDICVKKYKSFAQSAQDSELKDLCNKLASEEHHHLDMINQMLNGQEPDMSHNQPTQPVQMSQDQTGFNNAMNNQTDSVLCSDLLATEKYVSGTYDTAVFEAANPTVRQALQHIQQDEQHHGQELFNYMNSHGMYDVR